MNNEKNLLESLIEKPSSYTLDVQDNTMLPEGLKKEKGIKFTISPPTLEVLTRCAVPLLRIPEVVRGGQEVTLEQAIDYRKEMVEMLAILAHGKEEPPAWFADFLLNNLTPKELFYLFKETSLKLQSDFFLTSFQIADRMNPMTLRKKA